MVFALRLQLLEDQQADKLEDQLIIALLMDMLIQQENSTAHGLVAVKKYVLNVMMDIT